MKKETEFHSHQHQIRRVISANGANLVVFLTNHYSTPHVCGSFVLLVQVQAKCWRADAARYGSWPNRIFGCLGVFFRQT